jgi:hypothetical protein
MWSAHRIPQLHFQLSKPVFKTSLIKVNEFKMGLQNYAITATKRQ